METHNSNSSEHQHYFPPVPPPMKPVRTPILTVFLVLTFIACGFALLSGVASILLYAAAPDMASSLDLPDPNYLVLAGGLLFAGGKLVGATQMWKLKKAGFPIYTVCEVGAVILGIYSTVVDQRERMIDQYSQMGLDESIVNVIIVGTVIFSVAMSGLWIGVYAGQRKIMS